MDQNFLAWLHLRGLNQHLPGCEGDQGHSGRLLHGEIPRLHCQRTFADRDEFRECADAILVRAPIDFIAWLESTNARSYADYGPRHVVAENQGQAVRKDLL